MKHPLATTRLAARLGTVRLKVIDFVSSCLSLHKNYSTIHELHRSVGKCIVERLVRANCC
jgi:hypothetical protein